MGKLREEMLRIAKRDFTEEILQEFDDCAGLTRMQKIERWANFVKENPTKWKKEHNNHIKNILRDLDKFQSRILKLPNGKEKLRKLYKN